MDGKWECEMMRKGRGIGFSGGLIETEANRLFKGILLLLSIFPGWILLIL